MYSFTLFLQSNIEDTELTLKSSLLYMAQSLSNVLFLDVCLTSKKHFDLLYLSFSSGK